MNLLFDLVSGILRGVVKVVLLAMTTVFVLSVLCVGVALVVALVLRYVLTGRKPAVFTTVSRFNQAAQQFRPGFRPASTAHPGGADIVDVEAHEVRAVLHGSSKTVD